MPIQLLLEKLSRTLRVECYCRNSKSKLEKFSFSLRLTATSSFEGLVMIGLEAIVHSAERTRLACCFGRPGRNLSSITLNPLREQSSLWRERRRQHASRVRSPE